MAVKWEGWCCLMNRDVIKHVNSFGETITFDKEMILSGNNLFNYEWNYDHENNSIIRMYRKIVEKTINFYFPCNVSDAKTIRRLFYEHFEKDIKSMKKGYFELNGYRYYGWATRSVKDEYVSYDRTLHLTLTYATDEPYWLKNTEYIMAGNTAAGEVTHYPLTYTYTYGNKESTFTFINDSVVDADFEMVIYGQVNNPTIVINGSIYNVDVNVPNGSQLVINSRDKTILLKDINGTATSVFDDRNKNYDIFKRIPVGSVLVDYGNNGKVTLVVLEERGEPEWN